MLKKTDQEAEIIKLLRAQPDGFASGQAISRALGITRSAVWKHIGNLRSLGYDIEAVPSKGYAIIESDIKRTRRFNAIELESILKTGFVGRHITFLDTVGSTNTAAYDLAKKGASEGAAIIADEQTDGRGRLGRRWVSPKGVNIYTSVILRPRISPLSGHHFTFISAVAVAECLENQLMPLRPAVKWPNDILVGSKKIAGILLEMNSETDMINFMVVGIGLNVNSDAQSLSPELSRISTSMRAVTGADADRTEVLAMLYLALEKWYKVYIDKGFEAVLSKWRSYFSAEGRPIRVKAFERTIEGICAGVDETGALLVRTGKGVVERVISGDAFLPSVGA